VTVAAGSVGPVNGALGLNVVDNDSIRDALNTPLGGSGLDNGSFSGGDSYIIAAHVATPTLLWPPRNNHKTNDPRPTFSWSPVVDAAQYELVIATNSAFTANVSSRMVTGTSFAFPAALADGKYYCRVQAYNVVHEAGGWSPARAFTIDTTRPLSPAATLPSSSEPVRGVPTFRWKAVSDGVLYQFQFDNNPDFLTPLYTIDQRLTYRRLPGGIRGTYYWRVRAQDAAGNWSEWSPGFTVNILGPR